jgi:hypothetical protein
MKAESWDFPSVKESAPEDITIKSDDPIELVSGFIKIEMSVKIMVSMIIKS